MTDLYNYYVTNTIHYPEFNLCTIQNFVDHFANILTNGLLWIVVVNWFKHTGLYSLWVTYTPKKIIGLVYTDYFCHSGSMYYYTIELDIFIHSEHCHEGIGNCLINKILNFMDFNYQARARYK